MTLERLRDYCLQKRYVTESFPFDANTLVFKVGGKIFALMDTDEFTAVNLKCDPEKAIEFREQYSGIRPGYHMNKKHWNTVMIFEDVSNDILLMLIDHSYDLVFRSLPKKIRDEFTLG